MYVRARSAHAPTLQLYILLITLFCRFSPHIKKNTSKTRWKKNAQTLRVISNVFRIYNLDCGAIIWLAVCEHCIKCNRHKFIRFIIINFVTVRSKCYHNHFKCKPNKNPWFMHSRFAFPFKSFKINFSPNQKWFASIQKTFWIRNEIKTNVLLCVIKKEARCPMPPKNANTNSMRGEKCVRLQLHCALRVCFFFFCFPPTTL